MTKMDHQHRFRVLLTNSMSFGKFVFLVGFNQKTAKVDLFVKGNRLIPQDKQHGKTLEDSRRLCTEAKPEPLTCGTGRSHMQAGQSMGPAVSHYIAMSVLHRLKDCISAVYSSRFDPRA